MPKRDKNNPAKSSKRPVLPERLQRSLELRKAASDQRVAPPSPRTVPQHQGQRHQARGS